MCKGVMENPLCTHGIHLYTSCEVFVMRSALAIIPTHVMGANENFHHFLQFTNTCNNVARLGDNEPGNKLLLASN